MQDNETKILFITDIHQNIEALKKINFSLYDLIICGGDIIDPSAPDPVLAKKIIDHLPSETYIIPGNCDKDPDIIDYMKTKLNYIHKVMTKFKDIPILGIGYSRSLAEDMKVYREYFFKDRKRIFDFYKKKKLSFILDFCGIRIKDDEINILSYEESLKASKDFISKFVSFDEEEITKIFSGVKSLNDGILVTHSPPYKALDKLDGLPNIGSLEIASGIKKTKPKIVLCGHFHELSSEARLKNTIVFNPGAVKDNKYGEIFFGKDVRINFKNI